jgi:stage V sporulation protein AA
MSSSGDTLYVKIEKSTLLQNRHVTLQDIATIVSNNQAMVRQLKQMKVYSFSNGSDAAKDQTQVFSIMKIIQMIQQEYPNVEVVNLGEADFVLEYKTEKEQPKWLEICKTVFLSIVIFFGASFTIMAFNNDISVTDIFSKLYRQVMGKVSNGYTELEFCYSIGLSIGVLIFFNHLGKKKITHDPTPIQVEMRKYEKDVDDTFIENADRGGKSIDVE